MSKRGIGAVVSLLLICFLLIFFMVKLNELEWGPKNGFLYQYSDRSLDRSLNLAPGTLALSDLHAVFAYCCIVMGTLVGWVNVLKGSALKNG